MRYHEIRNGRIVGKPIRDLLPRRADIVGHLLVDGIRALNERASRDKRNAYPSFGLSGDLNLSGTSSICLNPECKA